MESKSLCPATIATVLACKSIAQAFYENIYELSHIRKEWSKAYAESVKKEAYEIAEELLSGGKSKVTIEKLISWREIMIGSLTDIGIIRASVKNDYRNDKAFQKEFYQKLGYNDFFSDSKNGDHNSMYRFIKTFAENLTPEMYNKIISGGLDKHIVDRIVDNSKALDRFSECFQLTDNPELVDQEEQKLIEKLYSEVRDISRIATAYYYFQPLKREEFNFFKVLRNLKQ